MKSPKPIKVHAAPGPTLATTEPSAVPAPALPAAPKVPVPEDRRTIAVTALCAAGGRAFALQQAVEQAVEPDKSELQKLLDEAKATAVAAEAAVIAMWDEAVAAVEARVNELEHKLPAATLSHAVPSGAVETPVAAAHALLVVTAKQDSRWRAGMNFTKAPRELDLDGPRAISPDQVAALQGDGQLTTAIVKRPA